MADTTGHGLRVARYDKWLFFFVEKGPAAEATDAPQPWRLFVQPCDEDEVSFLIFHFNGAPVEWNWQWKTEVLREKRVPVPLCPPQIPHGLTRDRILASAVRGRRLTAWAMAWPSIDDLIVAGSVWKSRKQYNYFWTVLIKVDFKTTQNVCIVKLVSSGFCRLRVIQN
jgi:hypothetical protein